MKSFGTQVIVSSLLVTGSTTAYAAKTPGQQFTAAVKKGDAALVQKLFDAGAVPGEGVTYPKGSAGFLMSDGLGYAEYHGHRDIAQLIVKRCQEAYVYGKNCFTAPCYVARTGAPDVLASFLAKGVPVDDEGVYENLNLLACAATEGNIDNTRFLIEKGADIEKTLMKLEVSAGKLASVDHPVMQAELAKNRAAVKLLERLRPGGNAPAAPASSAGISKAEMEQIVKSAVAASKTAAPVAPAVAAEIKSDVDVPAYKVTPNPDAFAVVVGVEKYNALPDARFAERDAKAMSAHLLAMGYPQRNIVMLTGSAATRTGLVKNLEAWLPNQVTERSTVMFYFSGHGAPDAKTSEAYLVPMDGDPQYLEETAYPIKRLYEKLAALKAKRVLVALDSCFSGAGGRSVLAQGTRPLVAKLKLAPGDAKVVSLSASSADEITGALEEQGHGLFTYHLLKALGETAGRGSVSELHSALTPRVQDEARRQNRAQTPQVFGAALDAGLR